MLTHHSWYQFRPGPLFSCCCSSWGKKKLLMAEDNMIPWHFQTSRLPAASTNISRLRNTVPYVWLMVQLNTAFLDGESNIKSCLLHWIMDQNLMIPAWEKLTLWQGNWLSYNSIGADCVVTSYRPWYVEFGVDDTNVNLAGRNSVITRVKDRSSSCYFMGCPCLLL